MILEARRLFKLEIEKNVNSGVKCQFFFAIKYQFTPIETIFFIQNVEINFLGTTRDIGKVFGRKWTRN